MIKILNCGGGVQSLALGMMVVHGEIEKPDHVVFADTGCEPEYVYEQNDWLNTHLKTVGLSITVLSAGNMREQIEHAVKKGSGVKVGRIGQPPFFVRKEEGLDDTTMLWRKCTTEFKIKPIQKFSRSCMGLSKGERAPRTPSVERWLGLSLDEVVRCKPSRDKWEVTKWPLIDLGMTRWDCHIWMKKHGYPQAKKSACYICPYYNDEQWRDLRDNAPDDFERACSFDDALRADGARIPGTKSNSFVHRGLKPLRDTDLSSDTDRGQGVLNLWGGECEGLCGT